jgi:hypothetical protein
VLGLWRHVEVHNRTAAADDQFSVSLEHVNGLTAMGAWRGTNLETLFTFVESGKDGIVAIDVVRNPDKLAYLKRELSGR